MNQPKKASATVSELPSDDPTRNLTLTRPDSQSLPHIGLVGDTYTIAVTGDETNGHFCVIDMYIPPGGGPPPHRNPLFRCRLISDKISFWIRPAVRSAKNTCCGPWQMHCGWKERVLGKEPGDRGIAAGVTSGNPDFMCINDRTHPWLLLR